MTSHQSRENVMPMTHQQSIDASHNTVKPAVVLKIQDGKSHYVTTIAP